MRYLPSLCILLLSTAATQAQGSLKDARKALLRGDYAEAREMYAPLAKDGKQRVPATIGVSRAYQSQGEYDQALSTIDAAIKDLPKDPNLLARRAELLHLRGKWDEAEKAARQAITAKDANFLARWVLGQVLRDRGDREAADEEFRWFVRAYNDLDITDPDELRLVGLAALERARYHHLGDQFQFVLNEIFAEVAKTDKDYWPAVYEAGRLFVEKHNKGKAHQKLDKALELNPRAAEALVVKGQVALQGFEMKDAENFADRALAINPRLVEALCLRADVYWFGGQLDVALKDLEKARAVNPRDESTLARIAACHHQAKKQAEFEAVVKEVTAANPKPHVFYTDLANLMEDRKYYDVAETYFKLAIELEPKLPEAQKGLGMLYMHAGREAEARKVLEQAFEADNFNVRVFNTLAVLDHLDKYQTLKTDHFIIRYDKKNDEVLARYMAKYLEDIYEELAKLFDYRPEKPILIEVFNKHEMFSGRVVAVPDLHTIGACTGPLIAMVSPRDTSKVIAKPFNWVRVMRHELVHVFNLDQTKMRVPHWFTEGLAVTYEGTGTPPSWAYLLAKKVNNDDLLNLDNILLGFIRPQSPEQWQQAYMQSQLYVEYLTKTHGQKAVGRMLNAFAEGLDTGPALEKAVQIKKAEFEKGYREFLAERVKNVAAKPVQKRQTIKTLKAAHEKNPDDADVAAQLAEQYYQIGNKKEAKKLADAVLEANNRHPLGAYVKALLLADGGDTETAYTLLSTVVDEKTDDVKPLKLLGKMQYESKKYELAAKTYERARKLEPNDPAWLVQLARVYAKTEDREKLMGVLVDYAKADPDDPMPRRKLARYYLDKGKAAEGEKYARAVLEIDVLDTDGQQMLVEALRAQGKNPEADELRKVFGQQ